MDKKGTREMIEIKQPNGKPYFELDQKDNLTRIKLCSYDEPLYLSIDNKAIPELIAALEKMK